MLSHQHQFINGKLKFRHIVTSKLPLKTFGDIKCSFTFNFKYLTLTNSNIRRNTNRCRTLNVTKHDISEETMGLQWSHSMMKVLNVKIAHKYIKGKIVTLSWIHGLL